MSRVESLHCVLLTLNTQRLVRMALANGVRRAEQRANFIVQRSLLEVSEHPYFDTEQVCGDLPFDLFVEVCLLILM